ncbi:MAG: ATP-binding protein [Streptosporangiaceae bacterium]
MTGCRRPAGCTRITHLPGSRGIPEIDKAVEDGGPGIAFVCGVMRELVEAADDRQLTKTINRYGRVDLLCVDELGYMELDRRGAELLFQVLTEREEKASVAIASNESFSKAHMFAATCARQRRNCTGSGAGAVRVLAQPVVAGILPGSTRSAR